MIKIEKNKREAIKKTEKNKYLKKVALLTLIAVASSGLTVQTSHAFFGSIYNAAKEKVVAVKGRFVAAKEKYDRAKKIAKASAYSAIGIIGYKKIAKPISKIIFGQKVKPIIRNIDRGLSITLLAGCAVGVFFIYNKFIAKENIIEKISNKIDNAKNKIIESVTEKIGALKTYLKQRFNSTDDKLSKIKEDMNKKLETTNKKLSEIDKSVKQVDGNVSDVKQRVLQVDEKVSQVDGKVSDVRQYVSDIDGTVSGIREDTSVIKHTTQENNSILKNSLIKRGL